MAQRVTIAHIADAAGVSVPTVSKVVNGRSDVAPETRERVERMLREHGYKRPAPARPHAHLLDVVFNELESPWAMEIIKGVEEVARENDLGVVLSAQEGPGALGRSWVDAVASRRSAGLILVVSELTRRADRAAERAQHPVRGRRPAGRAGARRPVGRRDQLERRPVRHAPPARTRPHAHRHDRRARRHALQPRARGRLPRGAGDGRADGRPGADPLGHVPRRGRLRARHGAAAAGGPADGDLRRLATCRPSASTRRRACWASRSPRSSA